MLFIENSKERGDNPALRMFERNPVNDSEGAEKCSVILPVVVKCILLPDIQT